MSLIDRAKAIYNLNSARQQAAQDAAINKAAAFWDRLPTAAQSVLDHQYAYQDALIDAGKKDGVHGTVGLTAIPGVGDEEPPKYKTPTDSAWSYSVSPVLPQTLEYINADLAKHYGMDVNTAYQEALSNTAYQREVKDMKAAGLNPAVLYGGGRGGSGADSFRGSSVASGGSAGGSSRRSGKSNSGKNLFTIGQYYGISTLAGVIGAIATDNPGNYWLFNNAAQGALTAISGAWKGRE